jgi:hypothetical protein
MNRCGLSSGCRQLLIVVVLSILTSSFAYAQSQFGSVVGTVTDSSGSPIPGVTVHATNEDSSLGFSTVSGSSGDYVIGGLLPGPYTIELKKDGFASRSVVHIVVAAGIPARADVSMSPGAVTQNVTVTANSAALSTESGTVVAQLSPQFLQAPTFIQPTQLPGDTFVAHIPGQFYLGSRSVAAYGSRGYDRRETLDGAVFGIINTVTMRMPRGSITDMQAVSLIADAEHETSNSTEMFTSKGTNNLHGSIWTELQNGALNQLPFTAQPGTKKIGAPSVGEGYIIGGPVRIPRVYDGRDKTFFFSTYQRYHINTPQTVGGTGATDAMRAGNLSGLGIPIKDPITGQPFANATIPAARISSIAQNIYNTYFPSITGPYVSPNFPANSPFLTPMWDLFLRGDHQVGPNDLLSVTYLHNHFDELESNNVYANNLGPNTTGFYTWNTDLNFVNVSENHIFSPTLMNEANFGVNLGVNYVQQSTVDGDSLTTSLGLPLTPGAPTGIRGGPSFNITGTSGLGWGRQNIQGARIWTVRDNVTKEWGHSSLKVGFELVRPLSNTNSFTNMFGTYNFSGMFTGNPFADYLLGLPSTTSRALPAGPLNVQQHELGFYASESLRAARKLTINAGIRVDREVPAIESHGKYYNFDLKTGQVIVPNQNSLSMLAPGLPPAILASIVPAASAGFPEHLVKPLWYVSPRLGAAYQLDNSTVVRTGFGVYATLLEPGAPTGGVFTPGTQNFTNTNTCTAGVCTAAFSLANPFPSSAQQAVSGLSINGTNPSLRSPRTYQWQLSFERQLSSAMVARVTYAGSHSSQLPYQRNVNLPPASTIPFSQSRLIYPQWFSITYADSGGNQSFNGLDAELRRQLSHGVTFDADYAWSKCLTDDDETSAGFVALGNTIEDPYNRARDRGNCQSVPRQIFRSTFVANSPFGSGGRWLTDVNGVGGGIVNSLLGGWTVSGMFQTATGNYFTPSITGITSPNTGQTSLRPDRVCSGTHPQNPILVFDPACFVAPPAGRYGNAGVGILPGLGYWQFDSGIYKYIKFAQNERVPRLRIAMNTLDLLGNQPKTIGGSALIVNSPATAGIANSGIYTDGTTANLGLRREIFFEFRLEW